MKSKKTAKEIKVEHMQVIRQAYLLGKQKGIKTTVASTQKG